MSMKRNMLLAMAMAMVGMANEDRVTEEYIPIFCGDCKHCPRGNKTFCRLARHRVSKTTPANKCEYYRDKSIIEG